MTPASSFQERREGGQREVGASDVATAIADCQARFAPSAEEMLLFAQEITKPLQAVVWNSFGDNEETKKSSEADN